MSDIILKDRLIYTSVILSHKDKTAILKNALLDTGSASTVISRNIANKIGLKPEPTDMINSVQGVGGSETVIEKIVDEVQLDKSIALNFHIQVGAMDYGIELDGIIGLDLLTECNVVMDLNNFKLTTIN